MSEETTSKDYSVAYIQNLSDQDIRNLAKENPNELRRIAETASSKLNSRKKSMIKAIKNYFGKVTANAIPNAYKDIGLTKKTVIAKKLTTNQVAEKLIDIRNVLNDKTSTFKGYRNTLKKISKGITKETRITMDDVLSNKNLAKRFWKLVAHATSKANITEYKYKADDVKVTYTSGNKVMQQLVLEELSLSGVTKNFLKRKPPNDTDKDEFHQRIMEALEKRVNNSYEQTVLAGKERDEDETFKLKRF